MEKEDIFEEIIDRGKRRGKLTYDEINDAVPSEYFSMDELEELMDLLRDMGIEVVDDHEPDTIEEEVLASEEEEVYEKSEDIVQAYFHSLGNISILKRDEELELAKRLEEGKEMIKGIITAMPLYKQLEASLDDNNGDGLKNSEEERKEEAFEMSLKALDNLMIRPFVT
jgi:RNA polymerase primary sigma factor